VAPIFGGLSHVETLPPACFLCLCKLERHAGINPWRHCTNQSCCGALRLSPTELLKLLIDAYQRTFHPPIAYLFSWLPFPLPSGVQDGILVYMAMAGVLYRTLSYRGRPPDFAAQLMRPPIGLLLRILIGPVLAAVFWPYFIASIFRRPLLLVRDKNNRDRGRLPPMDRKLVREFLAGDPGEPTVLCDERQLVVCYFVTLLAAMVAILFLNAAVNHREISFR